MAAGIDVIQLREPELTALELFSLTTRLVSLTKRSATRLVINDRFDVALASGADGVHLRSDSPLPRDIRAQAPPGFLIGRSVHTVGEAAASVDADYLIAGTVWPTASKSAGHTTIGLAGLRAIVESSAIPVLAIGGVTADRAMSVLAQGAVGLAAIGLFTPSDESGTLPPAALINAVKSLREIG